jgi:hypothetical protein
MCFCLCIYIQKESRFKTMYSNLFFGLLRLECRYLSGLDVGTKIVTTTLGDNRNNRLNSIRPGGGRETTTSGGSSLSDLLRLFSIFRFLYMLIILHVYLSQRA